MLALVFQLIEDLAPFKCLLFRTLVPLILVEVVRLVIKLILYSFYAIFLDLGELSTTILLSLVFDHLPVLHLYRYHLLPVLHLIALNAQILIFLRCLLCKFRFNRMESWRNLLILLQLPLAQLAC